MQAIGVGREGRLSTTANALSDAGLFGLTTGEAAAEIRRLGEAVNDNWQKCFRSAGVGKRELSAISRIIRQP